MAAGRREGTQATRGLRFGVGFSAPGSKLTATGTGRAWGAAKSGGNFCNIFYFFPLFCLRESEVRFFGFFFFFLVCFLGFFRCFYFFSFPYLAPLSYSFLSPGLHWGADISCPGIVIPFPVAACGTRSPPGSGLPPRPGRGCPPWPGTAGPGEAASRKTKRNLKGKSPVTI